MEGSAGGSTPTSATAANGPSSSRLRVPCSITTQIGKARHDLSHCRASLPLLGSNQDSPDPESGVLPVTPRGSDAFNCHGAEGDRTPDLCSAIAALSQLSYSPRGDPPTRRKTSPGDGFRQRCPALTKSLRSPLN